MTDEEYRIDDSDKAELKAMKNGADYWMKRAKHYEKNSDDAEIIIKALKEKLSYYEKAHEYGFHFREAIKTAESLEQTDEVKTMIDNLKIARSATDGRWEATLHKYQYFEAMSRELHEKNIRMAELVGYSINTLHSANRRHKANDIAIELNKITKTNE